MVQSVSPMSSDSRQGSCSDLTLRSSMSKKRMNTLSNVSLDFQEKHFPTVMGSCSSMEKWWMNRSWIRHTWNSVVSISCPMFLKSHWVKMNTTALAIIVLPLLTHVITARLKKNRSVPKVYWFFGHSRISGCIHGNMTLLSAEFLFAFVR